MGNPLTIIFSILLFPFTLLLSWVVVGPNEEKIILYWGKPVMTLRKPGLAFLPIFGRAIRTVSTKRQSIEVHKTTVADRNGNPIIVAGVCTFQVVDSEKAAFGVENFLGYLLAQAVAVLKQVASKYPYESPDGHCLKSEASQIGNEMVGVLQSKAETAGAKIISFELSDLAYSPEIAQAMLVRQQAQALVDARKIVAEGAVEIVHEAIRRLGERGFNLDVPVQNRLVADLLAIICGDSKVQPTYQLGSNQSAGK